MNLRRAAVVAVTVWVAVVLVGSTMVWAVISRAGREVIAVSDAPRAPATSSASPRTKPGHAGSGRPSTHPSRRHTQRPDGSTSTSPSGDGSQPSGTESSPGGQSSPSHTSHPGGGHTSAPPAGPSPRRNTWSGRGGTVMLECTGPKITDVSAYPDAGYRYEVEDKTMSSLEVKFVGSDEEHEVEVHGYCQGGVPHFEADDHGGEDEHDD